MDGKKQESLLGLGDAPKFIFFGKVLEIQRGDIFMDNGACLQYRPMDKTRLRRDTDKWARSEKRWDTLPNKAEKTIRAYIASGRLVCLKDIDPRASFVTYYRVYSWK